MERIDLLKVLLNKTAGLEDEELDILLKAMLEDLTKHFAKASLSDQVADEDIKTLTIEDLATSEDTIAIDTFAGVIHKGKPYIVAMPKELESVRGAVNTLLDEYGEINVVEVDKAIKFYNKKVSGQ